MAKVEIYTREFCPYCVKAVGLLNKKGVKFTQYDAGMDPDRKSEMVSRSHGGRTFPQVFINGDHVGGCDDLHALDRSGKLDGLLAAG